MRILKITAAVLAGFMALIGLTIGIARAYLPNTACSVTKEQVAALELENMTYNDVKTVLGCDGATAKKEILGNDHYVFETVEWRSVAWPYGKFSGEFINGTLHGTTQYWLNFELSANKD